MTKDEIIKLIDAGFSAEEIKALGGLNLSPAQDPQPAAGKDIPSTPDPEPAPSASGADKPAGEQDDKPAYLKDIEDSLNSLFESVGKINKALAMPSIGSIEPVGIEDVLSKFFKE